LLRSNLLPNGDCFAKERLAMTTIWQAHASALHIPPVLTVLVRAFLAGRAAQAETEKELRSRTLMPSIHDKAFKGEL